MFNQLKIITMKKLLTSILTCAFLIASFSIVPKKAEARWFAAMDIDVVYDTASSSGAVELAASAEGGSAGGSSSTSGSGAIGLLFECNFALATCDTEKQRYEPLPR